MNCIINIKTRRALKSLLLIGLLLVLICAAPLPIAAADPITMPTMDVWVSQDNNSTFINFYGLVPGGQYEVSLFCNDGVELRAGPCALELTSESERMQFNDFGLDIEPGNIVSLVYAPDDVSSTLENRYQVADFGITEVNVKTDTITGYSDGTEPVEAKIFYGSEDNPYENIRYASVTDGTWIADFSSQSATYGTYDINTLTAGIILQPDSNGNRTVHSWWAPNPGFDVNPINNTVSGAGWLGDVTVDLTPNDTKSGLYYIQIDGGGNFLNVSLDGADLYAGQTIRISDYMITKDFTVSSLRIEYIDTVNDKIYLASGPNAYVQFVIVINTPPTSGDDFVGYWDAYTDANGSFIGDFSGANPEIVYDLTSTTSGFTREYDGKGDSTIFDWIVSDYILRAGDLNGDGVIDNSDITILVKFLAKKIPLTDAQEIAADYDHNGVVNALDLKSIQQVIHQKVK